MLGYSRFKELNEAKRIREENHKSLLQLPVNKIIAQSRNEEINMILYSMETSKRIIKCKQIKPQVNGNVQIIHLEFKTMVACGLHDSSATGLDYIFLSPSSKAASLDSDILTRVHL